MTFTSMPACAKTYIEPCAQEEIIVGFATDAHMVLEAVLRRASRFPLSRLCVGGDCIPAVQPNHDAVEGL